MMRYVKTILLLVIGIIGTILYFVTQPSINPENFATVEGEGLEDVTIDGWYNDYDTFYSNVDTTWLNTELNYLESLDSPYSPALVELQKDYPDFVNHTLYSSDALSVVQYVESEDYVAAFYFTNTQGSYSMMPYNRVKYSIFDKATEEVTDYSFDIETMEASYYSEIIGTYLNGTTMKVVYSESNDDESELNMLTFDFSSGSFSRDQVTTSETPYAYYPHNNNYDQVSDNTSNVLVDHMGFAQVLNFETNEVQSFEDENQLYFVTNDNDIYGLMTNYELLSYDADTLEPVRGVPLDLVEFMGREFESAADMMYQDNPAVIDVMNDKVYVIKNDSNNSTSEYMVFDVESGDTIGQGTITYENSNTGDAIEAGVNAIRPFEGE